MWHFADAKWWILNTVNNGISATFHFKLKRREKELDEQDKQVRDKFIFSSNVNNRKHFSYFPPWRLVVVGGVCYDSFISLDFTYRNNIHDRLLFGIAHKMWLSASPQVSVILVEFSISCLSGEPNTHTHTNKPFS